MGVIPHAVLEMSKVKVELESIFNAFNKDRYYDLKKIDAMRAVLKREGLYSEFNYWLGCLSGLETDMIKYPDPLKTALAIMEFYEYQEKQHSCNSKT